MKTIQYKAKPATRTGGKTRASHTTEALLWLTRRVEQGLDAAERRAAALRTAVATLADALAGNIYCGTDCHALAGDAAAVIESLAGSDSSIAAARTMLLTVSGEADRSIPDAEQEAAWARSDRWIKEHKRRMRSSYRKIAALS